jgi:two-component system KDP operon response regulator KdpE
MASPAPVLLLIEDEPQMRRFLRATLRAHGYLVVEAATGREGLSQAAGRNPDLILLDLGLPDVEGLELTRQLRGFTRATIIVISARGQERDKWPIRLGPDTYNQAFRGPRLWRIRSLGMQRCSGRCGSVFGKDLRVDLSRRQVLCRNEVHLTPTEYKLLDAHQYAGRVITHRQLLEV